MELSSASIAKDSHPQNFITSSRRDPYSSVRNQPLSQQEGLVCESSRWIYFLNFSFVAKKILIHSNFFSYCFSFQNILFEKIRYMTDITSLWIVIWTVYGIETPSEDITRGLADSIENRFSQMTLTSISRSLLRSPTTKLSSADLIFLGFARDDYSVSSDTQTNKSRDILDLVFEDEDKFVLAPPSVKKIFPLCDELCSVHVFCSILSQHLRETCHRAYFALAEDLGTSTSTAASVSKSQTIGSIYRQSGPPDEVVNAPFVQYAVGVNEPHRDVPSPCSFEDDPELSLELAPLEVWMDSVASSSRAANFFIYHEEPSSPSRALLSASRLPSSSLAGKGIAIFEIAPLFLRPLSASTVSDSCENSILTNETGSTPRYHLGDIRNSSLQPIEKKLWMQPFHVTHLADVRT